MNILLNIFFVLIIKRGTRPHHACLPFPKMRDAHSLSASPFKLVPPRLLSLIFISSLCIVSLYHAIEFLVRIHLVKEHMVK
jgi:hypothetical protein